MPDTSPAPSSTFIAADGDGYELSMGRWSRRLAEKFLDFADTGNDEKVLDVGCGTGSLAFMLAARRPESRITGIDFSPAYIDFAKRKNTQPRVSFETGDACAMPYADKSFDRVMALLVLHYVREPKRAIAEMRRVARPGPTVAAAVWDARGGYVGNRIFFDTAAALDPNAEVNRARYYTHPMTRPGELTAAWREAGFDDVREDYLTIRMEYADFADYWKPVTGRDGPLAAYVNALGDAPRERFRTALLAAYCGGEADGPRSFAASAWAVAGTTP
jgi:ubiquinone/menaquinone biosynthesis C-methylase UbiE